jgi:hypothetical protein
VLAVSSSLAVVPLPSVTVTVTVTVMSPLNAHTMVATAVLEDTIAAAIKSVTVEIWQTTKVEIAFKDLTAAFDLSGGRMPYANKWVSLASPSLSPVDSRLSHEAKEFVPSFFRPVLTELPCVVQLFSGSNPSFTSGYSDI